MNLAGMIAANALSGDAPLAPWEEAVGSEPAFRLDVREPKEVAQGAIPGAVHIPIGKLRESLEALPKDQRIGGLLPFRQTGARRHPAPAATRFSSRKPFGRLLDVSQPAKGQSPLVTWEGAPNGHRG